MVFCTEFLDGWWSWQQCRTAPSAPYTRRTQRLSRPPPTQKLGAEIHMLQLNIWCSWWWAYVPETCRRAKNTSIKLPFCIKLGFQIISWGRSTVKQPSSLNTLLWPSCGRNFWAYVFVAAVDDMKLYNKLICWALRGTMVTILFSASCLNINPYPANVENMVIS